MEVCGVEIDFNKQNGYFINADCMEGMKQFPDKYFDLAIVDPPYGDAKLSENSGGYWNRFGQRFDRYKKQDTLQTDCGRDSNRRNGGEQIIL